MTEKEFTDKLNQTVWGQKYLDSVKEWKSLGRNLVKEPGFNIHHIHPVALGGKDDIENKVKLTYLEHCIAHGLLVKAIPSYKTLKPITKMTFGQYTKLSEIEKLTLEECVQWSNLKQLKVEPYHHSVEAKQKISNAHKGEVKTTEHRKKISESLKGRTTHSWSPEQREQVRKQRKGNLKLVQHLFTEEVIEKRCTTSLKKYGNRAGRILDPEIRVKACKSIKEAWKKNKEVINSPEFLTWYATFPSGTYSRRTDALKDYRKMLQQCQKVY